jgi:hypothetical protein
MPYIAGAFATMANNLVFCAHGCGEALLQLWWSPDTGDVGIFFPQGGGECRCAFYTSYPTTMVINYIPFTAVHFAAL